MSSVKGCFSICLFPVVFGAGEAHPSLRSLVSAQSCPPYAPAWIVDSSPADSIISDVTVHSFVDSHLHACPVCHHASTLLCGHQWWQIALCHPGPNGLATLIPHWGPGSIFRPQALLWAMS